MDFSNLFPELLDPAYVDDRKDLKLAANAFWQDQFAKFSPTLKEVPPIYIAMFIGGYIHAQKEILEKPKYE